MIVHCVDDVEIAYADQQSAGLDTLLSNFTKQEGMLEFTKDKGTFTTDLLHRD